MYRKLTLLLLLAFAAMNVAARQPKRSSDNRHANAAATGRDTLHVSQFGMKADSGEDAAQALQRAIAACREQGAHVLMFDNGRYDFRTEYAPRRCRFISNSTSETEYESKEHVIAMLLEDTDSLTIDGNGAVFMLHGKFTPVMMSGCSRISIKNLCIDFERPSMSEMKILNSEPGSTLVEIHPDSRYEIHDGRLALVGDGWKVTHPHCLGYDPDSGRCRFSDGWDVFSVSEAVQTAPRTVRFSTPDDFSIKAGTILSVRDIIRDRLGVVVDGCRDITLDSCTIRYMQGPGILCQNTHNLTMLNICCAPDPDSGRIMASSADFMHFSGCSGRIKIEGCLFDGAHDDGINVHGTHLKITERTSDNTMQLRFMHHQSYGFDAFAAGDTVAIVNGSTLRREMYAVVTDVVRTADRTLALTIDSTLPDNAADGFCVENMTRTPEVEIRRCIFTRTNTRGTLITTPRKVVIADCLYLRTGMNAILVADDADSWYESGGVCDMTVTGNLFIDCGYERGAEHAAVIAVCPSVAKADAALPVHKNIRIENNRFVTFGNPALYALAVEGLTFRNNKIEVVGPSAAFAGKPAVITEACTDTDIDDNTIVDRVSAE